MKFTVLGSTGFIGGRMVRHLREQGIEVETPPRDAASLQGKNLGHVIYAIGLTGNFRARPGDAIEAHVTVLQRLMEKADFESWLYLSSTRVYGGLQAGARATETAALPVSPGLDGLYDLSKLLGESVCLARDNPAIRVARLGNVYGAGMSEHLFLGSVMKDLIGKGKVTLREAPESAKDYISVDNVTPLLQSIATTGRERLYNVASGKPVTHQALAEIIRRLGYAVDFAAGAPARIFPVIDTARVTKEFGGSTGSVLRDLPLVIDEEKHFYEETHAKAGKSQDR